MNIKSLKRTTVGHIDVSTIKTERGWFETCLFDDRLRPLDDGVPSVVMATAGSEATASVQHEAIVATLKSVTVVRLRRSDQV